MAQTRSESPRQTDPRAQPARSGDGAPSLSDLDAASDPAGAEPMDLAAQIDSLLNEIEQASAAADPWGDAVQRSAEKVKEGEERTLEPSQKLLAKVRDGVAISPPLAAVQPAPSAVPEVQAADAAAVALPEVAELPAVAAGDSPATNDAAEVAASPEIAPAVESAVLAEALDAVLNEPQGVVAGAGGVPDAALAEESAEPSLAAELDAALKEAGDALEQIVPPEDPPAQGAEAAPVAADSDAIAEVAQAAPAAVESAAAAHWTNSGAGDAPTPAAATAEASPVEVGVSTDAGAVPVDADELDAALAEQAEELEESSRAAQTPAPAAVPASVPPSGEAEATADGAVQPAAGSDAEPAPAETVPAVAAHATQHSTVTPAANKTTTAASHATAKADANAPVVVPEAKPVKPTAPAKLSVAARVRAPITRLGNVLAMPLAMLPESARDIVAYLAAVTVFNAMAVWSYMLFIHTPTVPPPAHDAPALHSTEPAPKEHGGHGDAHGAAGHDAPHGDAHAKESKSGHGESAEATHAPSHAPAKDAHAPAHPAESHEPAHAAAPDHGAAHEPAPH